MLDYIRASVRSQINSLESFIRQELDLKKLSTFKIACDVYVVGDDDKGNENLFTHRYPYN